MSEYETMVVTFDPHVPKEHARQAVREHVEYGRWELHRTVVYERGVRRMFFRRRIIRVQRTA